MLLHHLHFKKKKRKSAFGKEDISAAVFFRVPVIVRNFPPSDFSIFPFRCHICAYVGALPAEDDVDF